MSIESLVDNYDKLAQPYPGRVVLVGLDSKGENIRLITVIAGRSPASRNRVYVAEETMYHGIRIKTDIADLTKPVGDPNKIIYVAHASSNKNGWPVYHVISNGSQTEPIAQKMRRNLHPLTLQEIQYEWETEGADSDYTSKISAVVANGALSGIIFGRIVRNIIEPSLSDRSTYQVKLQPNHAAYISTYIGDGTTTPQRGDPLYIPFEGNTLEETVYHLGQHMYKPNLVAIAGRELNLHSGQITGLEIWNVYPQIR